MSAIQAIAQKRHIERQMKKAYSLNPMQLHILCAVYVLNKRQISPKLSEICKYLGEKNVNNAYAYIGILERKALVTHIIDGTMRERGIAPKRFSILPKGQEAIAEIEKTIIAYGGMAL